MFLFSASMAAWALAASHVPTPWELYLLLMALELGRLPGGLYRAPVPGRGTLRQEELAGRPYFLGADHWWPVSRSVGRFARPGGDLCRTGFRAVALNATQIWIPRRFGMLALAALICTFPLAQLMPFAVASWYAALSLTTPLVIASVAAWSLYVILTSQSGMASARGVAIVV